MRFSRWVAVLLALVATSTWAKQTAPIADPGPVIEKPGPVTPEKATLRSVKFHIAACPVKAEGKPEPVGIYKVGGSVKPPKAIKTVLANFPDKARKAIKKKHLDESQTVSVLSFVVNAEGSPQDICVQKPAGFGMDEEAVKAAEQYRFQPATKDGVPVAVRIALEVNFRLY